MSVRNKMKYLLSSNGGLIKDGAAALEMCEQSFSRKMRDNTYSLKDLIDLAKYTGSTLAYIDKQEKIIFTLSQQDLDEDESKIQKVKEKNRLKKRKGNSKTR